MVDLKQVDEIERAIIERLSTVFSSPELKKLGDVEWTKREFETLTELGKAKGYKVVSSQTNEEWLFNLIWYKEHTSEHETWGINSRLKKLVLAVESEWSQSLAEIMSDFQKLLATNTTYRLMVCTAFDEDRKTLIDAFSESIAAYELLLTGSNFLLCMVSPNGNSARWS